MGRARLGALRPVPRLRHDRRAARRSRRGRSRPRSPGSSSTSSGSSSSSTRSGIAGAGHRAVRRLRRDARRRAPPHAPALHRAVRVRRASRSAVAVHRRSSRSPANCCCRPTASTGSCCGPWPSASRRCCCSRPASSPAQSCRVRAIGSTPSPRGIRQSGAASGGSRRRRSRTDRGIRHMHRICRVAAAACAVAALGASPARPPRPSTRTPSSSSSSRAPAPPTQAQAARRRRRRAARSTASARGSSTVSGDPAATAAALNRSPLVQYAEVDRIMQRHARSPNDPRFAELYGLNNTGQTGGTADADIDAPEGWDAAGLGAFPATGGAKVGIVDTGILADARGPDGQGRRLREVAGPDPAPRRLDPGRRLRRRQRPRHARRRHDHGEREQRQGRRRRRVQLAAVDLQGARRPARPGLDGRRRQLHHLGARQGREGHLDEPRRRRRRRRCRTRSRYAWAGGGTAVGDRRRGGQRRRRDAELPGRLRRGRLGRGDGQQDQRASFSNANATSRSPRRAWTSSRRYNDGGYRAAVGHLDGHPARLGRRGDHLRPQPDATRRARSRSKLDAVGRRPGPGRARHVVRLRPGEPGQGRHVEAPPDARRTQPRGRRRYSRRPRLCSTAASRRPSPRSGRSVAVTWRQ